MSHHFCSPSGETGGAAVCAGASWDGTLCSAAAPRYEPGTVTLGLLYPGPTVHALVKRTALSKRMRSFISITLRWRDFRSSQRFPPLACAGPLLDEIEDGRDEENTEEARG